MQQFYLILTSKKYWGNVAIYYTTTSEYTVRLWVSLWVALCIMYQGEYCTGWELLFFVLKR